MVKKQQYIIGVLFLVLLASGVIYISMEEAGVRMRIDEDKSTFYVKNENNRWVISGREYNRLFDGTTNVYRDKKNIKLEYLWRDENVSNETIPWIWKPLPTSEDGNILELPNGVIKIIRTTPYKRGPTIIDTYIFDSSVTNVELFPISHTINIINASGFYYRYTVDELTGTGYKRKLVDETELSFGRKMHVTLKDDYRWAWIGWPYGFDSVSAQYDIKTNNETFYLRLYDPTDCNTSFYTGTEWSVQPSGGHYTNVANAIASGSVSDLDILNVDAAVNDAHIDIDKTLCIDGNDNWQMDSLRINDNNISIYESQITSYTTCGVDRSWISNDGHDNCAVWINTTGGNLLISDMAIGNIVGGAGVDGSRDDGGEAYGFLSEGSDYITLEDINLGTITGGAGKSMYDDDGGDGGDPWGYRAYTSEAGGNYLTIDGFHLDWFKSGSGGNGQADGGVERGGTGGQGGYIIYGADYYNINNVYQDTGTVMYGGNGGDGDRDSGDNCGRGGMKGSPQGFIDLDNDGNLTNVVLHGYTQGTTGDTDCYDDCECPGDAYDIEIFDIGNSILIENITVYSIYATDASDCAYNWGGNSGCNGDDGANLEIKLQGIYTKNVHLYNMDVGEGGDGKTSDAEDGGANGGNSGAIDIDICADELTNPYLGYCENIVIDNIDSAQGGSGHKCDDQCRRHGESSDVEISIGESLYSGLGVEIKNIDMPNGRSGSDCVGGDVETMWIDVSPSRRPSTSEISNRLSIHDITAGTGGSAGCGGYEDCSDGRSGWVIIRDFHYPDEWGVKDLSVYNIQGGGSATGGCSCTTTEQWRHCGAVTLEDWGSPVDTWSSQNDDYYGSITRNIHSFSTAGDAWRYGVKADTGDCTGGSGYSGECWWWCLNPTPIITDEDTKPYGSHIITWFTSNTATGSFEIFYQKFEGSGTPTTSSDAGWTSITTDTIANLCTDSFNCSYTWDASGLDKGNYYIMVNATSWAASAIDGWTPCFSPSYIHLVEDPKMENSTINSTYGDWYDDNDLLGWCNATDTDGDNIIYNYTWYKNDVEFESGQSGTVTEGILINVDNISSSDITIADEWVFSCLATSVEDDEESFWLNSSTVTIADYPIDVENISLIPSTLTEWEAVNELKGYCKASNDRGNNIYYDWKWYKDDVLNETGNSSDTNYTQNTIVNVDNITSTEDIIGEWYLSCSAYDNRFNSSTTEWWYRYNNASLTGSETATFNTTGNNVLVINHSYNVGGVNNGEVCTATLSQSSTLALSTAITQIEAACNIDASNNSNSLKLTTIGQDNNLNILKSSSNAPYIDIIENWCYQETATTSTTCGGLSTGSYSYTPESIIIEISTFNNSLSEENLTFTDEVLQNAHSRSLKINNVTRYVELNNDTIIDIDSTGMDIAAYASDGKIHWDKFDYDVDDGLACFGLDSCRIAYEFNNPSACIGGANDTNWSTCFGGKNGGTYDFEGNLYYNFSSTIDWSEFTDINFSYKNEHSNGYGGLAYTNISCMNKISSTWYEFISHSGFSISAANRTIEVPADCVSDGYPIEIKVYMRHQAGGGGHFNGIIWYEAWVDVTDSYPYDPYLEIGTLDGSYEWEYSGKFTGKEAVSPFIAELEAAFNNGMCDCTGCSMSGDNCLIPFTFYSNTSGVLEYSNISIISGTATNDGYIYMNYTKPDNAISTSLWHVKHGGTAGSGTLYDYNVSIPTNCWNADSDNLILRIWSYGTNNNIFKSRPHCYNGTSWEDLGSESLGAAYNQGNSGQIANTYDGNWSSIAQWRNDSGTYNWTDCTGVESCPGANAIWEEGIYWQMYTSQNAADIFGFSGSNNYTQSSKMITEFVDEFITAYPRISPAQPGADDNLHGYCNATNLLLYNVTYNWTWYKNDVEDSSGSSGSYTQGIEQNLDTILSSEITADDNWTFQCLAYDDYDSVSTAQNDTVTVGGVIPVVEQIEIHHTNSSYQDDLIGRVWISDGDLIDTINVSWKWYNNSIEYSSGSVNKEPNFVYDISTMDSSLVNVGDVWIFSVNLYDGTFNSSPVWANSSTSTILNISSLYEVASPGFVDYSYEFTNESVNINVTASIDDDTVCIDWDGQVNLSCGVDTTNYVISSQLSYWKDGQVGNSLEFDGTNDVVTTSADLDNWTDMTLMAWVFLKSYAHENNTIISKEYSYLLNIKNDSTVNWWRGNGTAWGSNLGSNGSIPIKEWHHIVLTTNSTTSSLYIDGVLNTTGENASSNHGTAVMQIGGRTDEFSSGKIDEVRIWNRTLNSTEILNIYNNESSGQYYSNMDTTGLVGQWHFNETNGVLAEDTSGQGNNGTLTNYAPTYFREDTVYTGDTEYNLTWEMGENKTIYFTSHQFAEIQDFTFNITGYENGGSFCDEVKIYVNDSLSNTIGYVDNLSTHQEDTTYEDYSAINYTFTESGTTMGVASFHIPKIANVTNLTFKITGYENDYLDESLTITADLQGGYYGGGACGQGDGGNAIGQSITPNSNGTLKKVELKLSVREGYSIDYLCDSGNAVGTFNIGNTSSGNAKYVSGLYFNLTHTPEWIEFDNLDEIALQDVTEDDVILAWFNANNSFAYMISNATGEYYSGGSSYFDYYPYTQYDLLFKLYLKNHPYNSWIELGSTGGTTDWNYTGVFNVSGGQYTNGTSMASAVNDYLSSCTADASGNCEVKIWAYSQGGGILEISDITLEYTEEINPIEIDNDLVSDYLEASSDQENIPIIFYCTPTGIIEINDIKLDYVGGKEEYAVTLHNPDYSVSVDRDINVYYSDWGYSYPDNIDYLDFYPWAPNAKNVEPFGQTISTPILNISFENYGGVDENFTLYINESHDCVNITVSNTSTKGDGILLTTDVWNSLFTNKSYGTTGGLWMWADFECSYTDWQYWNPYFFWRGCCVGCNVCSTEVS